MFSSLSSGINIEYAESKTKYPMDFSEAGKLIFFIEEL